LPSKGNALVVRCSLGSHAGRFGILGDLVQRQVGLKNPVIILRQGVHDIIHVEVGELSTEEILAVQMSTTCSCGVTNDKQHSRFLHISPGIGDVVFEIPA
jgi:hypothetical protein